MLEVVFSDSVRASMKVANREVVGLSFNLDIGRLGNDIESDERKEHFCEICFDPSLLEEDFKRDFELYWANKLKEIQRLKDHIAECKDIRAWYSGTPRSLCGFYHLCWLLKGCSNKLYAIKLPDHVIVEGTKGVLYKEWEEIHPEKFNDFLVYEREVTAVEIKLIATKWMMIKDQNTMIRAVVNGELQSVNEDFYDYFIEQELVSTPLKMGLLIGNVLGSRMLNISDWWIAQRIKKMIGDGRLEVISPNENEYRQVIKLVE